MKNNNYEAVILCARSTDSNCEERKKNMEKNLFPLKLVIFDGFFFIIYRVDKALDKIDSII